MARPLRIELAGGLYYLTTRSDGTEAIYLDDAARDAWLAGLVPWLKYIFPRRREGKA